MAERLKAAGFEVWGFDVRPPGEFGGFAECMIPDATAFADRVETLISVVRDRRQTLELLFDEQAVMSADDPPSTVVLSSTLSPRVLAEVAERLPAGVALLDAPMSGAPARAADGALTFMVGGPERAVAGLMPAFQAMGRDIHHLGPAGAGLTCKVCNNFVAAAGVVAVRQALAAGAEMGIGRETLLQVMRSSSGATWYGDNLERISWAFEGYDPANTIGILEKDVESFLDALGEDAEGLSAAVLETLRALPPLEGGE